MTPSRPHGPAGPPFTVLFVCTGNICRSPLAAALARRQLAQHGVGEDQIAVASAGTGAVVGAAMDPSAAAELRALGADPDAARARQIHPQTALAADLILTAERRHRQLVVQMAPRALRTAFTMREFARLAAGAGSDRPRDVVAAARARRGQTPAAGADDDIPDPYRQPAAVHHQVAAAIAAAVGAAVSALCPPDVVR